MTSTWNFKNNPVLRVGSFDRKVDRLIDDKYKNVWNVDNNENRALRGSPVNPMLAINISVAIWQDV